MPASVSGKMAHRVAAISKLQIDPKLARLVSAAVIMETGRFSRERYKEDQQGEFPFVSKVLLEVQELLKIKDGGQWDAFSPDAALNKVQQAKDAVQAKIAANLLTYVVRVEGAVKDALEMLTGAPNIQKAPAAGGADGEDVSGGEEQT